MVPGKQLHKSHRSRGDRQWQPPILWALSGCLLEDFWQILARSASSHAPFFNRDGLGLLPARFSVLQRQLVVDEPTTIASRTHATGAIYDD